MKRNWVALLSTLEVLCLTTMLVAQAPAPPPGVQVRVANNQPGAPAQPQHASPPQRRAPFVLNPAQERFLDQVLKTWEEKSDNIKTFICDFTRWEYDPAWKSPNNLASEGHGVIKFKSPDRGIYKMTDIRQWDAAEKQYIERQDSLDLPHWVCTGKAIFEFDHTRKQLVEHQLPPEMQGKAITDGPLPFIFGAKADKVRQRYFLRDKTPAEHVGKQVWLEAFPRFQRDAANFERAEIILTDPEFLPYALQVYRPGGNSWEVYVFADPKVNGALAFIDFLPPHKPLGWKHNVVPAPQRAADQSANSQSQPKSEALRLPVIIRRK